MTEHPNAVTVRRSFEAWNSGRVDVIREYLSDDAVLHFAGNNAMSGTYRGRDAVMDALASMIHAEADLGWRGPPGCLWALVPGSVDNGSPAGGPGGRGSAGPGVLLPWSQGRVSAGQGACGRALMRCQAVTMSAAQGQLAWIFRRRRRPPRVSRAAACRMR